MAVLSTLKHHGSYDRTCLIYDNLCLYITKMHRRDFNVKRMSFDITFGSYFTKQPHYGVKLNFYATRLSQHFIFATSKIARFMKLKCHKN